MEKKDAFQLKQPGETEKKFASSGFSILIKFFWGGKSNKKGVAMGEKMSFFAEISFQTGKIGT